MASLPACTQIAAASSATRKGRWTDRIGCFVKRRNAVRHTECPNPKRLKSSLTPYQPSDSTGRLDAALKECAELKSRQNELQREVSLLRESLQRTEIRLKDSETENSTLRCSIADSEDKIKEKDRVIAKLENHKRLSKNQMHYIKNRSEQIKSDLVTLYRIAESVGKVKSFSNFKGALDSVFCKRVPAVIKENGHDILVVAKHGEGGYGRVARGYHSKYNWEPIVIKEAIPPNYSITDDSMRRHFDHEKRVLKSFTRALPRDFIPYYIQSKEENSHRFLVSVNAGRNISSLDSDQKKLMIGNVGQKLFRVLEKFHEEGYLHRDIKPENICVDDHGIVRLIDMGSSLPLIPGAPNGKGGRSSFRDPHCSLNMGSFKVTVDQLQCVTDDAWMVLFTLMDLIDIVPSTWKSKYVDYSIFQQVLISKQKIVGDPNAYFSTISMKDSNKAVFIELINYLKDKSVTDRIDYEYLAETVERLDM